MTLKLPTREDLTADEAVAMLELLKGFTVLGPWKYEEFSDGETDDIHMRWDRYCLTTKTSGAVITSLGDVWYLDSILGNDYWSIQYQFPTAELAMSAADAELAKREDVLAVGVERQVKK